MTVTAANDTVTYKSPRGDTERPADMVVAVNADGTAIGASPGTGATNLGKAEDAAHASGDVGVMALGVRKDTPAAFGADGDYTPSRLDQYGNQGSFLTGADGVALVPLAAGQAARSGSTPVAESTEGVLALTAPYPQGATPIIAASGNVAAATAAATLAGAASKTTYISGFEITGAGATLGSAVSVTVTGILGGTLTYIYTAIAGALLANPSLIVKFDPPLPGSATNTAIVVSCPSLGTGNTNNATVAHGFQL